MRKLIVLLIALIAIGSSAAFGVEVGDEPAISVREGQVRSNPGFLGRIIYIAQYGEAVKVLEVRGDWVKVQAEETGVQGWLHSTAIAETQSLRLEGADGSRTSGATSREIALAGRGFNEQVEARYESEKGLDFRLVDEMEGYGIPPDELGDFFAVADLTFGEGDAR